MQVLTAQELKKQRALDLRVARLARLGEMSGDLVPRSVGAERPDQRQAGSPVRPQAQPAAAQKPREHLSFLPSSIDDNL